MKWADGNVIGKSGQLHIAGVPIVSDEKQSKKLTNLSASELVAFANTVSQSSAALVIPPGSDGERQFQIFVSVVRGTDIPEEERRWNRTVRRAQFRQKIKIC